MKQQFTVDDLATIPTEDGAFRVVGERAGKTFQNYHGTLHAGASDLTFIAHDRNDKVTLLEQTKAQVIIVDPELPLSTAALKDRCFVVVSNPKLFFARAVNQLFPTVGRTGIHSTAIVDPLASIDPSASVGPYSIIGRATIGPRTHIDAHVQIMDHVTIGADCTIKSGVVIGGTGFGFLALSSGGAVNFPHRGAVTIGNHVAIGANTCIDRGALGDTLIGDHVKIDNLVHIAHNVVIEEGAFIIAHAMIAGSSCIGPRAWIAPSTAIRDQLQIGADATVGLGAVVTKDIPRGETWIGNPARKLVKPPHS